MPNRSTDHSGVEAWLEDYDRGAVERDAREREARREKWKWQHLVRRTILDSPAEKHVLRCLADHAWAGPDLDGRGREDGVCVLLIRTIARETGHGEQTIRRAVAELERNGVIECEARGRRGGGRGANRYRILPANLFEVQTGQSGRFGANRPEWPE